MGGRCQTRRVRALCRLSEKNLSKIVLEKEGIGHAQPGEELDDVAVEEDRLTAARGRVRAMLQVHFVCDDELRIARLARLRRAEECQQRAVWPKNARQLAGERLRGTAIEIIHEIPAQDPVDAAGLLRKSLLEKFRQHIESAGLDVPIEVSE